MKRILVILVLILSFSSCKSSKRAKTKRNDEPKVIIQKSSKTDINKKETVVASKPVKPKNSKAQKIINHAKTFQGVRYKWGGTTRSGMDCSGLVQEAFKTQDILLPRSSRDMATKGNRIRLKNATKGDLLFFTTGKSNKINHVGLVVAVQNDEIKFIHATTKRGVIISGLNENYWSKAFYEVRRVL